MGRVKNFYRRNNFLFKKKTANLEYEAIIQ